LNFPEGTLFHRATVPRYRGIGPEPYLNVTSQGELVLSLSKEHPRTDGRTAISTVAVTPRREFMKHSGWILLLKKLTNY
jgi:hypothetical protein